jgi:chromosomal replication initiator protein
VTVLDMLSPRRTWNVVRPRHVAMYLCRTMTPHTLPEIGRRFGDRDHTSVLHAFRRISDLIARKPDQAEFIEELKAKLTIKVPD